MSPLTSDRRSLMRTSGVCLRKNGIFSWLEKKNWKTVWMLELTPLLFSSWHPYSGSQSLSEHIPAVTGQGVGYILSIIYFESFIFILIVIEKKVHNYCLILPENQCVCQRKAHCCPETALSEWQLSHLSSTNPFLLQIKVQCEKFPVQKTSGAPQNMKKGDFGCCEVNGSPESSRNGNH